MRRCVSKDTGPQMGDLAGGVPHQLEKGKSVSEDTGPQIVMSHIGWGGEQNTLYKGVETFP